MYYGNHMTDLDKTKLCQEICSWIDALFLQYYTLSSPVVKTSVFVQLYSIKTFFEQTPPEVRSHLPKSWYLSSGKFKRLILLRGLVSLGTDIGNNAPHGICMEVVQFWFERLCDVFDIEEIPDIDVSQETLRHLTDTLKQKKLTIEEDGL